MNFVKRIARGAGVPLHPEPEAMAGGSVVVEKLFGGLVDGKTAAGVSAGVGNAVTLPPVFKALRLISETMGALPLHSYRRQDANSRVRLHDTPTGDLLQRRPNENQTAVEFWTQAAAHLNGWGSIYIGKSYRGRQVTELHLLEPRLVSVERDALGRRRYFENRVDGRREWSGREIIHVRLFTLDGINGLSPIGLQRETVGLSLAMRKQAASLFADGAVPSGIIRVKDEIKTPEVKDRLRKEWKDRHQGRRDIAVLDAGAEYQQVSISMADAQYIELIGATRTDIADMFNLPSSMLDGNTGDSMTYGNRVGDRQAFLTFTLHNPLKKIEQALLTDQDLFPDRRDYCEFLREDLMQPDPKGKAEIYRLAGDPKFGWMNRDEIRARENLPPDPDHLPNQGEPSR